ncbi:MAG: 23S rRNA (adenine(1618)-N(6))-methyltransferase RlmF [Mucilaginibacter sp.]
MPANTTDEKSNLHPRNKHRQRYDFAALIKVCADLAPYVSLNQFNQLSINFADAGAVKELNKSLLKYFYHIELWDIPEGFLCPPIPGRADYIHYVADLLAAENNGVIPTGRSVKVLDVGVGANCIYPLIGHAEYGWNFVGSDVDHLAVASANNIVDANELDKFISIRKQASAKNIFNGIIKPGEKFDLVLCNPPFHSSSKDAAEGTKRKWRNLGKKQVETSLNFGGQSHELWYEGGEERFVLRMIEESQQYAKNCGWFTSLISKKDTLTSGYRALDRAGATQVKNISMSQGQKVSRLLAWTFK